MTDMQADTRTPSPEQPAEASAEGAMLDGISGIYG